MKKLLSLLCSLALVAACSSSSSPSGGDESDGGAPVAAHDAGTPGSGNTDAGAAKDASAVPDGGGPSASDAAPANEVTLTLDVPASFTGTTRQLDVVVTKSLPIAGPPAAILYQSTSAPAVTAGQPLVVHGSATGVSGSYYVVAVLYMQGGGQFSPKAGVDYVAYSASTVAFAGAAIDLGTMTLAIDGADGGP